MERAGDKLSETVYYNTLARFHAANKEYSEAIECYQASLQAARESFNQNFVLDNLKAIGELYQSMGEEKEALVYLNRYIQAGDSVKAATGLQSNLDMQAELDKITNATSGTGNSFVNHISDIRRNAIPRISACRGDHWDYRLGFEGTGIPSTTKLFPENRRCRHLPTAESGNHTRDQPRQPALSESTRNDICSPQPSHGKRKCFH
jgi:tetratricopeptide (TPR) repeat protein